MTTTRLAQADGLNTDVHPCRPRPNPDTRYLADLERDLAELARLSVAALRESVAEPAIRSAMVRERSAYTVDDIMKKTGLRTRKAAARFMRDRLPFYRVGHRLFVPKWAWEMWASGDPEQMETLMRLRTEGLDYEVPPSMLPDLWKKRRGRAEGL